MSKFILKVGILGVGALAMLAWAAPKDGYTAFTMQGGVMNTRHNLTQSTVTEGNAVGQMLQYRNDYGAVCVYCHTPHGSNNTDGAPLWNRALGNTPYTTYDTLNTTSITAAITQPGVNSLTCLSCHDGTLAMDAILNMPGSGGYTADAGLTTADWQAQLNNGATGTAAAAGSHMGLTDTGCLACHNADLDSPLTATIPDFTIAALGTDLTNDHPVGINLPVARVGDDFNGPTATSANGVMQFYDTNTDGRANTNEIRFYNTGEGPEVECASCHDPHGVAPSAGQAFNPTFLRIANDGSAVCQTCHNK
ncbi:MAG: cytochrome c3 family protein [Motiliproteus sp.]